MTSKLTQIYDAENDMWSKGVAGPLNALIASAEATTDVSCPKRIYLFGADAQNPYWQLNYQGFTTQSYDPKTNNWTICASMPTGRFDASVAVVNDKLYLIGGFNYGTSSGGGPSLNRLIIYSAANEQYTPALDITLPVDEAQASPQNTNSTIPPPTTKSTQSVAENTSMPGATTASQSDKTAQGFTPQPEEQQSFPITLIATVSGISLFVICVASMLYCNKRNNSARK